MVFKKLLGAFGVGGPSVDTVLSNPNTRPGLVLDGVVHILGGDQDVAVDQVRLSLVTRVEVEGADTEHDALVEFARQAVTGAFQLPAGQRMDLPFQFPVPWETPLTEVYGQHLHGVTVGLRTELAVARAVDKTDADPVNVHPLPAQEAILAALFRLGFRFKAADLERGRLRGVAQTLPFYQEVELIAAPRYAHALSEIEVTLVANPDAVDVILEVDKRGGLFTGGHDVFHHFQVPHAGAGQTDWAAHIDAWLRQSVLAYAGHGHGHHGHGHHGFGGGLAAAGAGVVGGYLLGEALDGDDDDGSSDSVGWGGGDDGGDWDDDSGE